MERAELALHPPPFALLLMMLCLWLGSALPTGRAFSPDLFS